MSKSSSKISREQLEELISFYESFKVDFKYQFLDVSATLMHQYTLQALNELKEIKKTDIIVKS